MKPVRWPFCSYRLTVCGLNLERLLGALQKEGVPLRAVRRKDARTLVCECPAADLAAVRALVEDKGWSVKEVKPLFLSAWLARLRQRPGVLVGALLALALALTATRFVWRVDIRGAGAYRADIAAYLMEEGWTVGKPKTAFDAERIERDLKRRYPRLAWFRVYVYNLTLTVECTQGVPPPEMPSQEPRDLVAVRDGVVQSVQTFAGTPAVKAGDIVRKGQTLIYGQERGRDGETVWVAARGVVNARCWRAHTVRMSLREVTSVETGQKRIVTQVCTPWFACPAEPETPDYLAWQTYVSVIPVGGCFVPCWQKTVEMREVAMEFTPRDPDEVRKEAGRAAVQKLKASLRGYEIVDKWVDYCMIENDTLVATATAEWLMDIGGTAP